MAAQRGGPEVERPGKVVLLPGCSAVAGLSEPDVGGQGSVTGPVVAQVVPGQPDSPVRVDSDRGFERERAHSRHHAGAPGPAAVPRPGQPDRARACRGAGFEGGIDGAITGGSRGREDRKSTRLNSSHVRISYAVFCLKKKK